MHVSLWVMLDLLHLFQELHQDLLCLVGFSTELSEEIAIYPLKDYTRLDEHSFVPQDTHHDFFVVKLNSLIYNILEKLSEQNFKPYNVHIDRYFFFNLRHFFINNFLTFGEWDDHLHPFTIGIKQSRSPKPSPSNSSS